MSMQEAERRIAECKKTMATSLDLDGLGLTSLPAALFEVEHITRLKVGYFGYGHENQLNDIPKEISKLVNLQILDMRSNQLAIIPDAIMELRNLRSLYLSSNKLSEIPNAISRLSNLQILDLQYNRIQSLPMSISELSSLEQLRLNGNPIGAIPNEVESRGQLAIVRFYFEKARSSVLKDIPLFESKLLLVGEGRVGKTSLSKSLRIPNYKLKDEQSTEGIDIQRWTLPKEETGLAQDFRLNVWDFGGQEIYHATHQFFLTRRSLYILVTESRKEDKHDDFYYWLNVIRLLGDKAPVVVVLNKCDQPVKELPIEEYKKAFDNIAAYQKISCAPEYEETIDSLRAVICRILKDETLMAHVGAPLPGVWVQIRQEIGDLREQGLDYISYTQFLAICAAHGMTKDSRVLLLAGYFHDLGIFLHFEEDWDLSDTVILNPEWVTDGVYKVLDNATVKAQSGRFTDDDLRAIWAEAKYREKRRELLALMKNTKFELCYELPPVNGQKQGYLAPQLLPVDEIPYEWRTHEENLRFEYRYQFMPKGILARFIVKRHKDVVQAKTDEGDIQQVHWRYGVLLEWGNTRALVRERYFDKKITIALEGENKLGFLAIIRRSIEEIHDDFNNLEVDEMVPCNCDECKSAHVPHFFKFVLLQRYLRKGRHDITCDVSLEDVDVRTLLRESIWIEPDRDRVSNIYVGGDYIDVGDISDSENIALGREIDQRMDRQGTYLREPYRRTQPPHAGDFSRPVQGQPLTLSGLQTETLHAALLAAFDKNAMQRLLNFKLNRRMDEISMGQDLRTLYFGILEKASREGWTGALVEQAYRVNPGNEMLRAFVADQMAWLLEEDL